MFLKHVAPLWAPDGDAGAAPAAAAPAASSSAAPAVPVAFADSLPEDIRADASFRDIKDLGGLAKSYLNATKMIGGRPEDLVKLPAPDDAEGWNSVFTKLGRPEKPDGYKLSAAPDGVPVNEELRGSFLEAAHASGLTAKQADTLYTWWNGQAGGQMQAMEAAAAQNQARATEALKAEWGAAFDQNLHLARRAIEHFGGEDLAKTLATVKTADGVLLGDLPQLAKLFAPLGKMLSEDGVLGKGGGGGGADVFSPTEARQQIAALQGDPQFVKAWTDAKAPGHADAVAKMSRLYEFAHPSA